jgi:hypothetical protein
MTPCPHSMSPGPNCLQGLYRSKRVFAQKWLCFNCLPEVNAGPNGQRIKRTIRANCARFVDLIQCLSR